MKNFHIQKVLNEEDKVPFKLPASKMYDPSSIDIKGMAAATKRDADLRAEEERKQREYEKNKEKYAELIAKVQDAGDTNDQLEVLFKELVPSRGPADTVAGELVRAIMRILYRDYNDGDVFYEGYGIETCGGSVAYLIDTVDSPKVYDGFLTIAEGTYQDDRYTNSIEEIGSIIVDYILNNKSVWQPNTEDSRGSAWEEVYERDYREDWEPTYDYDFEIPPTVKAHIEAGNIVDDEFVDAVTSTLDNNGIKYDGISCWSDSITIEGLDRDGFDQVEDWRMWQDSFWDYEIEDWNDEYGDPNEEDDDEDDEDDDIDEALESPDFKKGDKVKYHGKVTTIVDVEHDPEFGVDYLIVNPDYDGSDVRYENIWVADNVDPV